MDYSAYPDGELLAIFKSGEIQGFNALFYRHWKPLFSLARKILEDDDLAKDATQEIFISLYEKANRNEITNLKNYLFQAVKYQCFMHLRSGKISERHLARVQRTISENDVEQYMDAQELDKLLRREMESLPEKCREVFYLSRFESLSNKKIAEQLNISQKTVEHQITKALKALRLSIDKLVLLACFIHF